MMSQIIRLSSGYIDSVNEPVAGQAATPGGTGLSKFAGQLGMEFELTTPMIRLKTPSVPVAAGKFMYVRLAAAASSPAVGATVNWDATALRSAYQVTSAAGTAAGTVLTPSVTPGNYTVIQISQTVPTGTIAMSLEEEAEEAAKEDEKFEGTPGAAPPSTTTKPVTATKSSTTASKL